MMGEDLGALDLMPVTITAVEASSWAPPTLALARIAAAVAAPGLSLGSSPVLSPLPARSLAATAALPRGFVRSAFFCAALTHLDTIASRTGGFHIKNVLSPDGDPSSSTISHSVPRKE